MVKKLKNPVDTDKKNTGILSLDIPQIGVNQCAIVWNTVFFL